MAEEQVVNQIQQQENKSSDKEFNFRKIEAQLREERQARQEAEKKAEEALRLAQEAQMRQNVSDDEEDDEPYVAPKKLDKKLAKVSQNTSSEIQKAMEIAKQNAKHELRQEMWLDSHPDFHDTMQLANKFYETDKEYAETILQMPEGFERQKLVYKAIKSMGLDKPAPKVSTTQDRIDANRRSPYYQPSGVANAPYAMAGDFSPAGQKNAYSKMQELKARIGK